jgi:hypothetical protein
LSEIGVEAGEVEFAGDEEDHGADDAEALGFQERHFSIRK